MDVALQAPPQHRCNQCTANGTPRSDVRAGSNLCAEARPGRQVSRWEDNMLRLAVEAVVGYVISPDKPSCYSGWKALQQTNKTGSMVAAAAQHACTRCCSHTFVSVTARVEHCQHLHTRPRRGAEAKQGSAHLIPSIHQVNVTAAQSSACVPCVRAQGVHCTVQQQNAQEMSQEREQRQSCMWGQTPGRSLC